MGFCPAKNETVCYPSLHPRVQGYDSARSCCSTVFDTIALKRRLFSWRKGWRISQLRLQVPGEVLLGISITSLVAAAAAGVWSPSSFTTTINTTADRRPYSPTGLSPSSWESSATARVLLRGNMRWRFVNVTTLPARLITILENELSTQRKGNDLMNHGKLFNGILFDHRE